VPRDAETWLAERGIDRQPFRLTPTTDEVATVGQATETEAEGRVDQPRPATPAADPTDAHGPAPSAREAALLARTGAEEAELRAAEREAQRPVGGPSLSDDVSEALQFIRRSTTNAPQSVGRLRSKLEDRDTPAAAIDLAVERAHAEGLVDDEAMVAALIEERRAKGHAPRRLRDDLRKRGFDRATIDRALAPIEAEDPEAAAFDVARARAERLTGVAAETAVRRVVGHLARRGYPEGLARKVAREAVFTTRDEARTAGH
jgi:regulatory protein